MALHVVRVPADRDHIRVLLLSDCHVGHRCFSEKALDDYLERAADDKAYIILLGDLIECATKTSPGKGYEDTNMPTNDQIRYWKSKLKPHKERIVGAVIGNHEERLQIDVMESICESLETSYLGYSGIVAFASDKSHACAYTFAVKHGSGGGVLPGGAVNSVRRDAYNVVADVYASAHVHKLTTSTGLVDVPDLKNGVILQKEQLFITNGALLEHKGSYAEMKGYPRTRPVQGIIRLSMLARNRGIWVET